MDTDVLNQIAQFGFPIVISLYLLIRMEQKIETLSTAITELNYNISTMTNIARNNENKNNKSNN